MENLTTFGWANIVQFSVKSFRCGYCGDQVASDKGFRLNQQRDSSGALVGGICICPRCNYPTLFLPSGAQLPGEAVGNEVQHVPAEVEALYKEARRCAIDGNHTAAVLICRKILMNLAVALNASPGLKFIEYVEYLASQGYVPPNGRHWVDHIRRKGNEATHEIALMSQGDSRELILFIEMLLRFIFEFPALVPTPVTGQGA